MSQNRQIKLAARPVGLPKRTDWLFQSTPIPHPNEGEVLIKTHFISLDPAMRGWMNEGKSYIPPVQLGEVMRAGSAGEVIESRHPDFQKGDFVTGNGGVQEYFISKGKHLIKVDPSFAPLPVWLGTLGMPGMTAYFGLLDVGQPKEGETVLVSGAAGAVGSVVGPDCQTQRLSCCGHSGGAGKVSLRSRGVGISRLY